MAQHYGGLQAAMQLLTTGGMVRGYELTRCSYLRLEMPPGAIEMTSRPAV